MELNINSPSYFTKQYGVIDEIYSMCRGISKHVENKQYSDLVDIVGITPIIAPIMIVKNILASIKTISRKAKIDYKQFCEDIFQYCKLINLPIESNLKV